MHLDDLLPLFLLRPLGWALVHSLWQVTLLALLYRGLELSTRPSAGRVRYAFGCLVLVAAIIVPAATFTLLARAPTGTIDVGMSPAVEAPPVSPEQSVAAGVLEGFAPNPASGLEGPIAWTDDHARQISALWLFGVCLSLGLLLRSWRAAVRLADRASGAPSVDELALLDRLRRRLRVATSIRLKRSPDVDSPLLIGWRRPVVLLPQKPGELPADVLESVLAHELAHVRRHDYAVNLLQQLAGRLLFFHPAFHWLSDRVNREREACCDALAAAACQGGALGYARGLVVLEEARGRTPALGVSDGGLTVRIRLLLEPPGLRMARLVRGAALMSVTLIVASFGGQLVAAPAAPTVIDGFDPVLMIERGERTAGVAGLTVEYSGYRYRFASRASRDRFLADSQRYSVRNLALCPVSGRRVLPDTFQVIDGHIVLFCCPDVSAVDEARAATWLRSVVRSD